MYNEELCTMVVISEVFGRDVRRIFIVWGVLIVTSIENLKVLITSPEYLLAQDTLAQPWLGRAQRSNKSFHPLTNTIRTMQMDTGLNRGNACSGLRQTASGAPWAAHHAPAAASARQGCY